MDFSTIFDRLESGFYVGPEEFVHNVRLIFSNSRAYNTVPRSRVSNSLKQLNVKFSNPYRSLLNQFTPDAKTNQKFHRDDSRILRTRRL